jgi:hypothetical protein
MRGRGRKRPFYKQESASFCEPYARLAEWGSSKPARASSALPEHGIVPFARPAGDRKGVGVTSRIGTPGTFSRLTRPCRRPISGPDPQTPKDRKTSIYQASGRCGVPCMRVIHSPSVLSCAPCGEGFLGSHQLCGPRQPGPGRSGNSTSEPGLPHLPRRKRAIDTAGGGLVLHDRQ